MNYTPMQCKDKVLGAAHSAHRGCATAEQSSAARLYEHRLARSRLSAPSLALRTATQVAANLSPSAKKQKDSRPNGQLSFCKEAHKRCVNGGKNEKKVRNTFYKDELK